jgi:hypothetical protein
MSSIHNITQETENFIALGFNDEYAIVQYIF